MNDKTTYRKWVGIVLGLVLHGSAHFLSGKRADGIKWYFSISACSVFSIFIVAIPGISAYIIGMSLLLTSIILLLVMLKQSYRPVPRIGLSRWAIIIIINLSISYSAQKCMKGIVRPFKIPSSAMSPTLIPGDHLFVEKLSFRIRLPRHGDVIVFKTDDIISLPTSTFYIKRIAGIPGDKIRIEPPNLIINNKVVNDPPIFKKISSTTGYQLAFAGIAENRYLSHTTDEITLGKDEYFVLGDNTHNSRDSRYWGPVPRKNIIGKATRIYWPLSRINQSITRKKIRKR